jgi:hypothetical protein
MMQTELDQRRRLVWARAVIGLWMACIVWILMVSGFRVS